MSFVTSKIEFTSRNGEKIAGKLETPVVPVRAWAVFAHCFTCSKDIHAATRISQSLTRRGFGVLRFDFTGLGNSDGDFSNTNFSTNRTDLLDAIEYMNNNGRKVHILIGHSLGGAVVLSMAGEAADISAVVSIAAPSDLTHLESLMKTEIPVIEAVGEAKVKLAGRTFTIRKQFLDDIRSIQLEHKLSSLNAPVLVMHSPDDEVISVEHGEEIFLQLKQPKNFIALERMNHLIDEKEHTDYVSDVISSWVNIHISEI